MLEKVEYIDILDHQMKRVGCVTRDEAHQKGYWHQSFHCWVIRRIHGSQYVLFQRRGPHKTFFPNLLDTTAAGHLASGETPREGLRELDEELGIAAKFEDLISLGIKHDVLSFGSIINCEFCHVYLLECNLPFDRYTLQLEEVTALVQMKIQDGMRLFSGEVEAVPVSGFEEDDRGNRRLLSTIVSKRDMLPRLDSYYLKICIMAEMHFKGSRYLAI